MNDDYDKKDVKTIGIIGPISEMKTPNGVHYTSNHWKDVQNIIKGISFDDDRIDFSRAKIVSENEGDDLIHSSIVNNIYNMDIIICDVSGSNANVMFELGMRLAFDKPIIIINDNKTNINFDVNSITHIMYDCDLPYPNIVELKNKIKKETEQILNNKNYSFLEHFANVKVKDSLFLKRNTDKLLINKINSMQSSINELPNNNSKSQSTISDDNYTNNNETDYKELSIDIKEYVQNNMDINNDSILSIFNKVEGIFSLYNYFDSRPIARSFVRDVITELKDQFNDKDLPF